MSWKWHQADLLREIMPAQGVLALRLVAFWLISSELKINSNPQG